MIFYGEFIIVFGHYLLSYFLAVVYAKLALVVHLLATFGNSFFSSLTYFLL